MLSSVSDRFIPNIVGTSESACGSAGLLLARGEPVPTDARKPRIQATARFDCVSLTSASMVNPAASASRRNISTVSSE
jgi:hypothetical protein